jgi:hypothetical protein
MEQPRRTSKLDDDDLFGPPDQPQPPEEPQGNAEAQQVEQAQPSAGAAASVKQGSVAPVMREEAPTVPAVSKPRRSGRRSRGAPPPPITRNVRRVSARGPVSDDALVSFNCKMTRGLRRAVKHYAADVDVDIQDVVAAALEDYLDERGVPFPGSDQAQPD